MVLKCDTCKNNDRNVDAVYRCAECGEHFCEDCMDFHNADEDNTRHTIKGISPETNFCSTCKRFAKDVEASLYCVNCTEPRSLCYSCACMHSSMKTTRSHVFSTALHHLKTITTSRTNKGHGVEILLPSFESKVIDKNNHLALGKPYSVGSKSHCITLTWETEDNLKENENYLIMMKEVPNGRWRQYTPVNVCQKPYVTVNGLKSDTSYVFKVRVVDLKTGTEGPFTEESDILVTKTSPALAMITRSEQIIKGPPAVYRLPIEEDVSARNEKVKIRKFNLGTCESDPNEKTIMIVGETGSGKSLLINGIANYIMGVTWEDSFRFNLINLETCDMERMGNEIQSGTEWVTCYTIHNRKSDRINYTVNLIDTPGFGNARGMEQDFQIVDQIREFLTSMGEKRMATLDAVCFIIREPDARLTDSLKYMYESILSLFGKDIKDNICTLITFADGRRPPVLVRLQSMENQPFPCDTFFTFNNSALFVDNTSETQKNFFWDMGITSCETFFDHLSTLQPNDLSLTKKVCKTRQKLKLTFLRLQQEIDKGLSKVNILEDEVSLLIQNKRAMIDNQNFEYIVEECVQEIHPTEKGQSNTNCLICNFTCHESCDFADDKDKARCCAMNSEGKCTECPQNCHWTQHKNTPYTIKLSTKKVKKCYNEMKKKYEEARQKTPTQEPVLEEMNKEIESLEQEIQVMLEVISKLNNRLKEIALRPGPLSTVEYIDLMISSEKQEKKWGFESRIDALEKCKQRVEYGHSVRIFQDRVRNTRKTIAASEVADEVLKDESTGVTGKIKKFLGNGK